jgi:hypothetical protein
LLEIHWKEGELLLLSRLRASSDVLSFKEWKRMRAPEGPRLLPESAVSHCKKVKAGSKDKLLDKSNVRKGDPR